MSTDTTIIENFKTSFNINTNVTDVHFRKINAEPYDSLPQNHQFGERLCLLYKVELQVFNVEMSLRILAFTYDCHAEVLKLEIKVCNELLSKEIASCKNFLQRKRNMNLTFEVLIKFAKLFEMRRLICLTVFQKQANVSTITDDTGIVVKCCNEDFRIKFLELTWSITWKVNHYEVSDFIEFYLNYAVLKKDCEKIKQKLEILVEPDVDFQLKLKSWKGVMADLYGCAPSLQNIKKLVTKAADVLEISDSDSDESVIEIDKSLYHGDEIMVID